jgi:hypothetical protein
LLSLAGGLCYCPLWWVEGGMGYDLDEVVAQGGLSEGGYWSYGRWCV